MELTDSLQSKLSTIMDTMVMPALAELCKVVGEETAELRLELARLRTLNTALTEKVNKLDNGSTGAGSVASNSRIKCAVAVQTEQTVEANADDGDIREELCLRLWKERYHCSQKEDNSTSQQGEKGVMSKFPVVHIKRDTHISDIANHPKEQQEETKGDLNMEVDKSPQKSFELDGSADFYVDTEDNSNTNQKFSCDQCGLVFFNKGTLTLHQKQHIINTTFCFKCKKQFLHSTNLKSHVCQPQISFVDATKTCEVCGKTFSSPSGLEMHKVVHTGARPFVCSFCGKGFTQKGNMKNHMRIHTGKKLFHCTQCDMSFMQSVQLKHHSLLHHGSS
uniref:zinc finger protein 25-like n=1 Tax=Doryrhamphus excisus TaxID=161450 RepID=UPI0025AE6CB5|nr:zinc finger protein 25-like [Doryrhamphus excisus]